MDNIKIKELSEYQRKVLEIAKKCANDIKRYEEQTKNTVEPNVRQFLLNMYIYGLDNNLSIEQVFEIYKKRGIL